MKRWLISTVAVLSLAITMNGYGQLTVSAADGSDGVFNPTDNITVDLSQAPTGAWNGPNAQPGHGVYDPEKWAVVFRYSDVNIPTGKTVTFKNHPSYAPVVWIVSGNVTISGTVNLSGARWNNTGDIAEPGPGGHRGALAALGGNTTVSAGFGPGGGGYTNQSYVYYGGSYRTLGFNQPSSGVAYGNNLILPLIGGSGSSVFSNNPGYSGGAGGGAILIVCQNTVAVTGAIYASGGYGSYTTLSGSGGAIRIVADTINGGLDATLRAVGYQSYGQGRIRLEANTLIDKWNYDPQPVIIVPVTSVVIWPEDSSVAVPSIRIEKVSNMNVPADPHASLSIGQQDVTLSETGPSTILLSAKNVPDNWTVYVRIVPRQGQDFKVTATKVSGDVTSSIWQAQAPLPLGMYSMQARAVKPAQ